MRHDHRHHLVIVGRSRDLLGLRPNSVISCHAGGYTYDGMDRLTTSIQGGAAVSFAYDDADNMTMNTGICAGSGTLVYPAAGPNAVRPHAPTSICGTAVSYDAAGNTLSYDVDGAAGPKQPRSFLYDGENRPIAIRKTRQCHHLSPMAQTVSAR